MRAASVGIRVWAHAPLPYPLVADRYRGSGSICRWRLVAEPTFLSNQRDESAFAKVLDVWSSIGFGQADQRLLLTVAHGDDESAAPHELVDQWLGNFG